MNNLNKIFEYFSIKLNHKLYLLSKDSPKNKYWPEIYDLKCQKCNQIIITCIANIDLISKLECQLISLYDINFISKYNNKDIGSIKDFDK